MTLIELMVVITIIGIFVAMGFPAMGGILEDRQTGRAAEEITNLFRVARARAAATGAAHRILATANGATGGTFVLRTALTAVGGPSSSCLVPVWTDADSSVLTTLAITSSGSGSLAQRDVVVEPLTGVSSTLEFCFSPGGVTWTRNGAGVWSRPAGAQVTGWRVYRTTTGSSPTVLGVERFIRIMPSGLPSIEAK